MGVTSYIASSSIRNFKAAKPTLCLQDSLPVCPNCLYHPKEHSRLCLVLTAPQRAGELPRSIQSPQVVPDAKISVCSWGHLGHDGMSSRAIFKGMLQPLSKSNMVTESTTRCHTSSQEQLSLSNFDWNKIHLKPMTAKQKVKTSQNSPSRLDRSSFWC